MSRATPGIPQSTKVLPAAERCDPLIELVSTTGVRGLAVLIYRGAVPDETAAERQDPATARVYGLAVRLQPGGGPTGQASSDPSPEVWRTSTRFDADRGSAMAWIMAIAHRRAVDRLRSIRESAPPPPLAPAPSLGRRARRHAHQEGFSRQSDATHTEAAQVREALARLTPEHLGAVELAYLETLAAGVPADLATILSTLVTTGLAHEPEVPVTTAPTDAPTWPGGRAAS